MEAPGPYLSERQWGTVREDDSTNGDAWSYSSHDQARSRIYRWCEGIKDHDFSLDVIEITVHNRGPSRETLDLSLPAGSRARSVRQLDPYPADNPKTARSRSMTAVPPPSPQVNDADDDRAPEPVVVPVCAHAPTRRSGLVVRCRGA